MCCRSKEHTDVLRRFLILTLSLCCGADTCNGSSSNQVFSCLVIPQINGMMYGVLLDTPHYIMIGNQADC